MTEQLTKTVTICNQTLYLLCEESMIMIRFDTVPERDARTDGQNCYIISISRVSTLTRDKNEKKPNLGCATATMYMRKNHEGIGINKIFL